tara:strand:- start:30035 stop:30292 length:258 start_codon:yes stop_codon:yes gene_type:complete
MAITKTYAYNKRTDDFGDLLGIAHRVTLVKDGVTKKISAQEVIGEADELGIATMTDAELLAHCKTIFSDELIEAAFDVEDPPAPS